MTIDKRSLEYQKYLITREHEPSTVKPKFSQVRNKTRVEARKKQEKQDKVNDVIVITRHNPTLLDINKIIKNNSFVLHTDEDMEKLFLPSSHTTLYRREKNVKQILSPSLFPPKFNKNESSISS